MTYQDSTVMPFGKHKGKELIEVPANYLLWLGEQIQQKDRRSDVDNALLEYIQDNKEVLQKEVNEG